MSKDEKSSPSPNHGLQFDPAHLLGVHSMAAAGIPFPHLAHFPNPYSLLTPPPAFPGLFGSLGSIPHPIHAAALSHSLAAASYYGLPKHPSELTSPPSPSSSPSRKGSRSSRPPTSTTTASSSHRHSTSRSPSSPSSSSAHAVTSVSSYIPSWALNGSVYPFSHPLSTSDSKQSSAPSLSSSSRKSRKATSNKTESRNNSSSNSSSKGSSKIPHAHQHSTLSPLLSIPSAHIPPSLLDSKSNRSLRSGTLPFDPHALITPYHMSPDLAYLSQSLLLHRPDLTLSSPFFPVPSPAAVATASSSSSSSASTAANIGLEPGQVVLSSAASSKPSLLPSPLSLHAAERSEDTFKKERKQKEKPEESPRQDRDRAGAGASSSGHNARSKATDDGQEKAGDEREETAEGREAADERLLVDLSQPSHFMDDSRKKQIADQIRKRIGIQDGMAALLSKHGIKHPDWLDASLDKGAENDSRSDGHRTPTSKVSDRGRRISGSPQSWTETKKVEKSDSTSLEAELLKQEEQLRALKKQYSLGDQNISAHLEESLNSAYSAGFSEHGNNQLDNGLVNESLDMQSTTGSESERSSTESCKRVADGSNDEGSPSKKICMRLDERELTIPLEHGWNRQTIINGMGRRGIVGEVLYFAPCGKKMKTIPDVMRYLERNPNADLGRENFSFNTKVNVGQFFEVQGDHGSPPVPLTDAEVLEKIEMSQGKRARMQMLARKRRENAAREQALARQIMESKLKRRMELQDISRRASEMRFEKRLEHQTQKEMEKKERECKVIERRKEKEQHKMLKQQEKMRIQEQLRKEREMRAQQIIEARNRRQKELEEMRLADAVQRNKEREMKRQQLIIMKEQERERRRQHLLLVKALEQRKRQEEKQHQRQVELEVAMELKKPVEDMELKNAKPLPAFPRLKSRLAGRPISDCLMVVEFLNNFGTALNLDKSSIPTLESLERGLLKDSEDDVEDLMSLVMHLLRFALDDVGVPNPKEAMTRLNQKITEMEMTDSTMSEVLRIFVKARGEKEMSDWLSDKPMEALNPTKKAALLAFLCNELLTSKVISCEIDKHMDSINNLRRDKWIVEGQLRQLRVFQARKFNKIHKSTDRRNTNTASHANHLSAVDDDTMSSSKMESDDEDDKDDDDDKEDDEESGNESDGSSSVTTSASTNSNAPFEPVDESMTREESDKKIEKLRRQHAAFRQKVFRASLRLRAINIGQDRYKRIYWILPLTGGVYVEGLESGVPEDYLKENEVKDEKEDKDKVDSVKVEGVAAMDEEKDRKDCTKAEGNLEEEDGKVCKGVQEFSGDLEDRSFNSGSTTELNATSSKSATPKENSDGSRKVGEEFIDINKCGVKQVVGALEESSGQSCEDITDLSVRQDVGSGMAAGRTCKEIMGGVDRTEGFSPVFCDDGCGEDVDVVEEIGATTGKSLGGKSNGTEDDTFGPVKGDVLGESAAPAVADNNRLKHSSKSEEADNFEGVSKSVVASKSVEISKFEAASKSKGNSKSDVFNLSDGASKSEGIGQFEIISKSEASISNMDTCSQHTAAGDDNSLPKDRHGAGVISIGGRFKNIAGDVISTSMEPLSSIDLMTTNLNCGSDNDIVTKPESQIKAHQSQRHNTPEVSCGNNIVSPSNIHPSSVTTEPLQKCEYLLNKTNKGKVKSGSPTNTAAVIDSIFCASKRESAGFSNTRNDSEYERCHSPMDITSAATPNGDAFGKSDPVAQSGVVKESSLTDRTFSSKLLEQVAKDSEGSIPDSDILRVPQINSGNQETLVSVLNHSIYQAYQENKRDEKPSKKFTSSTMLSPSAVVSAADTSAILSSSLLFSAISKLPYPTSTRQLPSSASSALPLSVPGTGEASPTTLSLADFRPKSKNKHSDMELPTPLLVSTPIPAHSKNPQPLPPFHPSAQASPVLDLTPPAAHTSHKSSKLSTIPHQSMGPSSLPHLPQSPYIPGVSHHPYGPCSASETLSSLASIISPPPAHHHHPQTVTSSSSLLQTPVSPRSTSSLSKACSSFPNVDAILKGESPFSSSELLQQAAFQVLRSSENKKLTSLAPHHHHHSGISASLLSASSATSTTTVATTTLSKMTTDDFLSIYTSPQTNSDKGGKHESEVVDHGLWFSLLPRMPCDELSLTQPTQMTSSYYQQMSSSSATPAVHSYLTSTSNMNSLMSHESLLTSLRLLTQPVATLAASPTSCSTPGLDFMGEFKVPQPPDSNPHTDPWDLLRAAQGDVQPIPKNKQHGWWRIYDLAMLKSVMSCTLSRGIRERNLQRSIHRYLDYAHLHCTFDSEKGETDPNADILESPGKEGTVKKKNDLKKNKKDDIKNNKFKKEDSGKTTEMNDDNDDAEGRESGVSPDKEAKEEDSTTEIKTEVQVKSESADLYSDDDMKREEKCAEAEETDYVRPDDPQDWSVKSMYDIELAALEEVEALEDRIFQASLQAKQGWRPNKNTDLKLVDRSVTDVSDAESYPMDVAISRLLELEANIERRYLKPPLIRSVQLNMTNLSGHSDRSDGDLGDDEVVPPGLLLWRQAVVGAESPAQLSLCTQILAKSISWEKSIMRVTCQICRKDDNEAELLLCDGCDKGYHTYCFKPKMENIPEGDWYCFECVSKVSGTPHCVVCGTPGGRIVSCQLCPRYIHLDCADPPLPRMPKRWQCLNCVMEKGSSSKSKKRKEKLPIVQKITITKLVIKDEPHDDAEFSQDATATPTSSCATPGSGHPDRVDSKDSAKAASDRPVGIAEGIFTPDSEKKTRKRKEKEAVTPHTPKKKEKPSKKERKIKEKKGDEFERSKDSLNEEKKTDKGLHKDLLSCGKLLREMEKHQHGWPFLKPVNKKQFPSYKKYIKFPMDFGTTRSKIKAKEYKHRQEFAADIRLIFNNCETFNEDDSEVGQAGYTMKQYFESRWLEIFPDDAS